MYVAVYGSGYLATVISACIADFGTPVSCFEPGSERIVLLAQGKTDYFERNLEEVLRRNIRAGRLSYSTELESSVRKAQIIFMAQDRPVSLEKASFEVLRQANTDAMLVIATPVPVGSARKVEAQLRAAGIGATVVSQPMFLTDGCAVEDFNWPDRILLGTSNGEAVLKLKQLYRPLVMRGVPVIVTTHETAELVRESTTAFVAAKIAFINEVAALCERVGADAVDLALALGLDKKIAPRCLQPGAVFGGAFAQHDMESLANLASGHGTTLRILDAAREVNASLAGRITDKICATLQSPSGKEIGLLGLSFKPNTNSVAGSSSLVLARSLKERGARVRAYDPVAMPRARNELSDVRYCESAYAASEGADALVVGTAWPEFRALDFDRIKRLLKQPVVIDTKNLLDGARLRSMGYQYVGVGRT